MALNWPSRQTLVVLHLRAQGLEEGDEHPHAVLWIMVDFTFLPLYNAWLVINGSLSTNRLQIRPGNKPYNVPRLAESN